ncbi:MAG: hypothetical protein PHR00_03070 [Patescibacteria group bacterium]|nr:hypothetical protein [Patescibacteria group bacterium]
MKSKSIFGFTLIEIVLVVFIIAFLGSLAFVSTKSILNKSKENQKIDDIKTLQTALDLYKSNEGFYPTTSTIVAGQPLLSSDGTKTYLKAVPNPVSNNSNDAYYYYQLRNGSSYKIDYRLKSKVGDFPVGKCSATLGSVCKTCNSVCTNKCAGELDSCEDQTCSNPNGSAIISDITATADTSKTSVMINWTAFFYTNTTYKLEYSSSTNGGASWSAFNTLAEATTTASYNHTDLNSNYQYKYKITPTVCSSVVGTSVVSSPAGCIAVVSAPTDLTLTPITSGIKINWSAVAGVTNYLVYGTANNSVNVLTTTTSLNYTKNNLVDGNTYYFRVAATICGNIATSSQQSAVAGGPDLCGTATLTTECSTSTNSKGDLCGGGYLFCEGEANCGGANLVASMPISNTGNCSYTDNLKLKWRLTSTTIAEASPYDATNTYIGYLNLNGNATPTEDSYNPDPMYAAAAFCATSTMSGFDDWYLPSSAEICAMIRSGNFCESLTTSCLAGNGQSSAKTPLNGCTNDNPLVGALAGDDQSSYWQSKEAGGSYPGYSLRWRTNTGTNTLTSKHTTLPKLRCIRRF